MVGSARRSEREGSDQRQRPVSPNKLQDDTEVFDVRAMQHTHEGATEAYFNVEK